METVNAFGLACPKPLMMAKAKIDEGARELSVHVDNEIAVKNVSRLAEKYGLTVAGETIEGVSNLAGLNSQPNTAVQGDPTLYAALEAVQLSGSRRFDFFYKVLYRCGASTCT